ncbi:polysaccharide deacetylase [hydrocarbon metagenome]|uniref:Polysaccharide deacetylase n=1 Tax=hydrocarbon metagenome TaxID=938273 RepID=A0A0W8E252_9ZZZZ
MKKSLRNFVLLLTLILLLALAGCQKQTTVNDIEEPSSQPQETVQPVVDAPQPTKELPAVETPSSPVSTGFQTLNWYYVRNQDHKTPRINTDIDFSLADYDAYYIGSKEKVIFLTFDEGYENGYTAEILDTLKVNQVPAAFFVTGPYITSNPELVKRMVAEGHIVGNHSQTHPSMPSKTSNPEAFKREITDVEKSFLDLTGQEMPKYIRPPRGEYSEKSLQMTKELGYKTIFWSFAYQDWLVDQQPDPEASYQRIMQGTHNGQIMLLHAVSSTNTQILDRVIKDIQKEGYRFAPLTELEQI